LLSCEISEGDKARLQSNAKSILPINALNTFPLFKAEPTDIFAVELCSEVTGLPLIIFIDTILTPFNIKWGCKWFGHDWYITDMTENITEPAEPKAICLKCHKYESFDKIGTKENRYNNITVYIIFLMTLSRCVCRFCSAL
jgi:hypothetical protein